MPLTHLLSDFISNQSPAAKGENTQHALLSLQLKLIDLAQDPESYERYLRLAGNGTVS